MSAVILAGFVVAFPILMTLASAHRAAPCLVCVTFWALIFGSALSASALGAYRQAFVATALITAFVGARGVAGDDYASGVRRDSLGWVARRLPIFADPLAPIADEGATISGIGSAYDGRTVLATNCSACLTKGLVRLLIAKGIQLKSLRVLAPNPEIATRYREIFDPERIVVSRDDWRRFGPDPNGPPVLFRLADGRVLERIP